MSLRIRPGTLFALIGPNGAGKTTLLKIVATLMLPDAGEVLVAGYRAQEQAAQIRSAISYAMGDEHSFYWRLTAQQNLEFFAALYDLRPQQARQKISEWAEAFRVETSLDRPYEELSTGTRQRLALIRSFLNDAAILLADEPTRSMDPASKRSFQELLRQLARKRGKTVLFTTHDLQEAWQLADQIGILNQGRLEAVGAPEELENVELEPLPLKKGGREGFAFV